MGFNLMNAKMEETYWKYQNGHVSGPWYLRVTLYMYVSLNFQKI